LPYSLKINSLIFLTHPVYLTAKGWIKSACARKQTENTQQKHQKLENNVINKQQQQSLSKK